MTKIKMSGFVAITLMLAAMLGSSAHAITVATVDMQRVKAESKAAQHAKSQLEAKQQEFQEDVSGTEQTLQQRNQELAKQRSLLSSDAFKEKLTDFRKEAATAQKDVQRKRLQLRRAFEMSIVAIQKRVQDIVADIANDKDYDLVLPSSKALYHSDSLDITDTVIERLNEELPELDIEFEESGS